jgi:regulator of protease activity HflC (stomatin/prohibitin superfamily)
VAQWERIVILRLGKFKVVAGPGLRKRLPVAGEHVARRSWPTAPQVVDLPPGETPRTLHHPRHRSLEPACFAGDLVLHRLR